MAVILYVSPPLSLSLGPSRSRAMPMTMAAAAATAETYISMWKPRPVLAMFTRMSRTAQKRTLFCSALSVDLEKNAITSCCWGALAWFVRD